MDATLEYYMTATELAELISRATLIGLSHGREARGTKLISQNRAYELFGRRRVEQWVADGMVQSKPAGNGKTSTIKYDYARLLEIDAANVVKVRKGYEGKK